MIVDNGLIFGIVTLVLALIAVLIAFEVIKRVAGKLSTCWKFLLLAIIVFAIAKIIGILNISLQLIQISIAMKVLDIVFIILLIVALWDMLRCIKETNGEIKANKKIRIKKKG